MTIFEISQAESAHMRTVIDTDGKATECIVSPSLSTIKYLVGEYGGRAVLTKQTEDGKHPLVIDPIFKGSLVDIQTRPAKTKIVCTAETVVEKAYAYLLQGKTLSEWVTANDHHGDIDKLMSSLLEIKTIADDMAYACSLEGRTAFYMDDEIRDVANVVSDDDTSMENEGVTLEIAFML